MTMHTRPGSDMQDPAAFDFDGDYGENYDYIARTVIPGYEQTFGMAVALLAGRVPADARVLIAGTGTGREIDALARANPGWRFSAADPSAAMIRASTKVALHAGAADRVTFHHGVVENLDAADFDAATLFNVLHFLPDDGAKQSLIDSIAQRLRSGASLVLFDLHGSPGTPAFASLLEAWHRFMEWNGLAGEARRVFIERLERGIVYVPESRIIEICDAAGLELTTRWFTGLLYGGWLLRRR